MYGITDINLINIWFSLFYAKG